MYIVTTEFGYYVAEAGRQISPLLATFDEAYLFMKGDEVND